MATDDPFSYFAITVFHVMHFEWDSKLAILQIAELFWEVTL